MDLKEVALDYLESFGFNVLPMQATLIDGKVSKSTKVKWKKYQDSKQSLTDLDAMDFNTTVNGIAAVCGVEKLRCFDFDKCTDISLVRAMAIDLGLNSDCEWIIKSGNGYHLYFKADGNRATKTDYRINGNYKCKSVELMWSTHLINLPPSEYPGKGFYSFVNVENGLPTEAPAFITEEKLNQVIGKYFLTAKTSKKTNIKFDAEEGGRNNTLISLLGKLIKRGFKQSDALDNVLGWNSELPEPLPSAEVKATTIKAYGGYAYVRKPNISAYELSKEDVPPITWLVKNLIPEGLCVLAGRPKIGKSFMVLNLAFSIADGTKALGSFETVKSDVLYVTLEDGKRRVFRRQDAITKAFGLYEAPKGLFYPPDYDYPELNDFGVDYLNEEFDLNPNLKLVIFDTMNKTKPASKRGNEYEDMYNFLVPIQEVTQGRNVAIIFVHHGTKAKHDDPIDSVLGTTAITAAADLVLVLYKPKDSEQLRMSVTGRELEDNDYEMTFKNLIWSVGEDFGDSFKSPEKEKIIKLFEDGCELSTGQVEKMLEISNQSASNHLRQLLNEGTLMQPSYGRYKLRDAELDEIF